VLEQIAIADAMARGAQPRGQAGNPEQRAEAAAATQILSRPSRAPARHRDDAPARFEYRPQTRQCVAADEIEGAVVARQRVLEALAQVVDHRVGGEVVIATWAPRCLAI
jgi:hypothetical protein